MASFWSDRWPRWRNKLATFALSMLWALLMTLLILVPEWLFSQLFSGFIPYWGHRTLLVIYLLNLFIINAYHRRTALFFAGYLYFLQLTALVYYRYFGSFYGPADVMLLFFDANEVFVSLAGVLQFILMPLLVVGGAFATFVFIYRRIHAGLLRSRISSGLFALLMVTPVIHASLEDNSQKYEPDATNLALKNALYSVSYFLGGDLPKRINGSYTIKDYQPYSVTPVERTGKYHVVLVMGESLTYTHMSLYGYERQTTPFLESLRDAGKLIYRPGISTAVATRVSVPMFMNVQYEPDNWSHIANKESSLFQFAKQSGFQTAFISSQMMDGTSSQMSSNAIDHWFDQRDRGDCRYDECLIDFLQRVQLDWKEPAFVVLNQRSAHSPYKDNYPAEFAQYSKIRSNDYVRFKIDSYDDAVRYVDYNLERIINHLQAVSSLPLVVLVTADHGQKMGEDGRFGHNTLELASARVPFLFYNGGAPDEVEELVQALPAVVPHYELARLTARLLGYEVNNPNSRAGEYYLNGIDLMGRAGYMSYRLSELPEYQRQLAASYGTNDVP